MIKGLSGTNMLFKLALGETKRARDSQAMIPTKAFTVMRSRYRTVSITLLIKGREGRRMRGGQELTRLHLSYVEPSDVDPFNGRRKYSRFLCQRVEGHDDNAIT